jgi:hypothetical protein
MPEETLLETRSKAAEQAMSTALPPQFPINLRRGVSFRRTKGNISVLRFHYACHPERDPDLHPEWIAAERRKYTSQASWDREQEIVDEAGGGELVFADTCLTTGTKSLSRTLRGSLTRSGASKAASITARLIRQRCCAPITASTARSI